MRLNFTAEWIFQGWIMLVLLWQAFYTQAIPLQQTQKCDHTQYEKYGKCCSKCKKGEYMTSWCTETSETKCLPCGLHEYQDDWNTEGACIPQIFCDKEKGYQASEPETNTAALKCVCMPGFQCLRVYCEFCEKVKVCPPGYGVQNSTSLCKKCPQGFFSNVSSATDPCMPWTDCKKLGMVTKQPGNATNDVACDHDESRNWILWGSVLSTLTLLIAVLLIVLLVCYKERFKKLYEDLRLYVSSVQNTTETPVPTSIEEVFVSHSLDSSQETPLLVQTCEKNETVIVNNCLNGSPQHRNVSQPPVSGQSNVTENEREPNSRTSEPEEVGDCSCVSSLKGPLELGENELNQLYTHQNCSCGTDNANNEFRSLQEVCYCSVCCGNISSSVNCGDKCSSGQATDSCQSCAMDSTLPAKDHATFQTRIGNAASDIRHNLNCSCSMDTTNDSFDSFCTGVNLEENSKQDKENEDSTQAAGDSSSVSGNVMGNNNTTFISNGKVMNFSGEVIFVYVSQMSQNGSERTEEDVGSPVQEESTDSSFQGEAKQAYNHMSEENISYPLQEESLHRNDRLPIQEESKEWMLQSCV
ncbi:tumor necrosis factor receptor superfamily member 11A isoform X1 [Erpetoichthys calabaricus]|uniref:TNF receptor superfamily member 11a n=2 Tax=Erpetoichthys calabaricus TaxID=27687 RepID=A0A8C4RJX5_ERPCA|nr:tumor necrosis factor receptor superfamily member 11A isoform X1 [Erpetoichthys calabaricus]